jgi:hypothetical protein
VRAFKNAGPADFVLGFGAVNPKNMEGLEYQPVGASLLKRATGCIFCMDAAFIRKIGPFP